MQAIWNRYRRLIVVAAVTLVLALVAVTAYAVWTARQDSADSGFTAAAVGAIDIGTVEANHLFDGGVPALSPGDSDVQCIIVESLPAAGTQDAVRLYTSSVTDSANNLGDQLNVTIEVNAPVVGQTPGYTTCSGGTFSPAFDGTLNSLGDTYPAGVVIGGAPDTGRQFELRVTVELDAAAPVAVSGETASAVFTFEGIPS